MAVALIDVKKAVKEEDESEEINNQKENVRIAAAEGVHYLQSLGIDDIEVDGFNDSEAAAEGVTLKLWHYNELKNSKNKKPVPKVKLYQTENDLENQTENNSECQAEDDSEYHTENNSEHQTENRTEEELWNLGALKGEAQNIARQLTDTPANLMTPTIFANYAVDLFQNDDSVNVIVRDKRWAKEQQMNIFLSVAQGATEPPVFLEVHYKGDSSASNPIVLVGKGVTFDSGGINIKSTSGLAEMRGDKGGAACVLATTYAVARLGLPINLTTLIPLCENMPGSVANKPGDVIRAKNGKTVRIDNTDAEGRLILADALLYADSFNPQFIIDVATLTGAMAVALGTEATGVFTNSNSLWEELREAGKFTGDRVWRMPLWKSYGKDLKKQPSVDITNIVKGSSGGGACSAAAFLKEFVPPVDWMHLDIAGVMGPNIDSPYLPKGMTGRPTRTLIEFLRSKCQR